MNTFDPKQPYSICEGDSRARYYQAGIYYNAAQEEISQEEAAKPSIGGSFQNAVQAAVKRAQEPSEAEMNQRVKVHDPSNPQNQRKPDPVVAEVAEVAEDPRRSQLVLLETKELNSMVAALGRKKFKGHKAKVQAIDWLLANTE